MINTNNTNYFIKQHKHEIKKTFFYMAYRARYDA